MKVRVILCIFLSFFLCIVVCLFVCIAVCIVVCLFVSSLYRCLLVCIVACLLVSFWVAYLEDGQPEELVTLEDDDLQEGHDDQLCRRRLPQHGAERDEHGRGREVGNQQTEKVANNAQISTSKPFGTDQPTSGLSHISADVCIVPSGSKQIYFK